MTVEEILTKYERPEALHGGEPVKAPLLKDLNTQKRSCNRIYGSLFGIVCLVTLISVIAVVIDLMSDHKSHITLLAVAGIPVPFMLNSLRRSAEQWSQLTLLITLVSYSDEKTIQGVIKKLLASKAVAFQAS